MHMYIYDQRESCFVIGGKAILRYPAATLVWPTRATNLASKYHMTIFQAVQEALMTFCGFLSGTSV